MAKGNRRFTPVTGDGDASEEANAAEDPGKAFSSLESTIVLVPAVTMRKLAKYGAPRGISPSQMVSIALARLVKELESDVADEEVTYGVS